VQELTIPDRPAQMRLGEKRRRKANSRFLGDEWDNDSEEPVTTVNNDNEEDKCTLRCFGRPAMVHQGNTTYNSKVR